MTTKVEQLKEGVIVKGDFWPEEIRVHLVKILGNRVQVVGAGLKTQKSYSTIHYLDDFEKKIQIVYGVEGPKFSANAKRFRLALEATRIKMSYEFDACNG